jgi:SAM-dependent methyltransferase
MTTIPCDPVLPLLPTETERYRFQDVVRSLAGWSHLFHDQRCLDFGASWGTSMIAMLRLGASHVTGVEIDAVRVGEGEITLNAAAPEWRWDLYHTPDTRALPFADGAFDLVLANAVFEHIPQPRSAHIAECWRVLRPGGVFMVHETPNKYWPREDHTTHAPNSSRGGLWFNHWLPRKVAHRRAVRRGRFNPSRTDWNSSGWRGLGYYELVASLDGFTLIPETSRPRHRWLTRMGLPASLLDPYPTWILRKAREGGK